MKNIKIAFTGTFDIDNFGDHLFPVIFKKMMEKKNISIDMDLFSPFEAIEGFQQNNKIYKLELLDSMNKKKKYDAIVVGGGEIIHLNTFKHLNHEKESVDYPIYETWIAPSLASKNTDTKIIWNNPGCPFEFKKYEEEIIRYILSYVDYISVRNDFSYRILNKFNKPVMKSYDTAFALPIIYPLEELDRKIKNKYIVYHCHRYMNNEFYQESFKTLKSLSKEYEIVLLPLANTNDDIKLLKQMYEDSDHKFKLINEDLSIKGIIEILAHCEMYIGVSFHGAITAYVYGKKIIGYDYFRNKKTSDLFHDLSLESNYIDKIGMLDEVVKTVLSNDCDTTSYSKIIDNINSHFDNIIQCILNKENKNKRVGNEVEFFEKMIKEISFYFENIKQKSYEENGSLKYDLYEKMGEAQYNLLNWQKCSNELITLDEKYRSLEKKYEGLLEDYDRINNELNSTLKNRIKKYLKKR